MQINVTHEINDKELAHILDTMGRGARYWADSLLEYESEVMTLLRGKEVDIVDRETVPATKHKLTRIKLLKGLQTMAKESPDHFADIILNNYDNNTGDVLLQYCIYGELVYS